MFSSLSACGHAKLQASLSLTAAGRCTRAELAAVLGSLARIPALSAAMVRLPQVLCTPLHVACAHLGSFPGHRHSGHSAALALAQAWSEVLAQGVACAHVFATPWQSASSTVTLSSLECQAARLRAAAEWSSRRPAGALPAQRGGQGHHAGPPRGHPARRRAAAAAGAPARGGGGVPGAALCNMCCFKGGLRPCARAGLGRGCVQHCSGSALIVSLCLSRRSCHLVVCARTCCCIVQCELR